MKNIWDKTTPLIRILLWSCFFMLNISSAQAATSVTQSGITWTFDGDYTVGQFVNGDYYVIDSGSGVTVTSITPSWDGTQNGSMVNPVPSLNDGYHASTGTYDPDLNAALSLPLVLNGGDVLISTTGYPYDTDWKKTWIDKAAILTILNLIPPEGSFRPGYCDEDRVLHNKNNLDYSLLSKLNPTTSAPNLTDTSDLFARPWIDHVLGWQGRSIHPASNMPDYGGSIAGQLGMGALALHLNYSDVEKEQLLINYVQVGIDFYSILKSGGEWGGNGGHGSGRKWPILFAGIMLDDNNMKNIGEKSGDYIFEGPFGAPPDDYISFGEDEQTFYVTQNNIDITNGPSWNPDTRGGTPFPYTTSMMGMPEWGISNAYFPQNSDSAWYAEYRSCCTAFYWDGYILAAHIMGAKNLWNHNALFDYQDRYMAITNGDADPFGYTVVGESTGGYRGSSAFVAEMWDTYRDDYYSSLDLVAPNTPTGLSVL